MLDRIMETDRLICRGKRKDNQEWIYGFYLCVNNQGYIVESNTSEIIHSSPSCSLVKAIPVLSHTVGPYSFAYDAEGDNIFDGDVIETIISEESPFSQSIVGLVVFESGGCYADGMIHIDADEFVYCKIIGNIHDNPELLTELIETRDQLPTS